MAYTDEIVSRARARLEQRQQAHRDARAALRDRICQELPRVKELEVQLRRTAPRIVAASLRQGLDGKEALAALRRENLALQDEEAALLDGAGYPVDALDETPFCPLCGDRGWIGAEMCGCLRSLCQEEQIRELSSLLDLKDQSFETFRLDYYDREVPPGYKRSPRENMQMVLSLCRTYAELFGDEPHRNLFLSGPPGLGKTFLSACIARTVSEKGFSVVYDSAPSIFARFEKRRFARSEEEGRQADADTRRYLACDLLILDDLGTEFVSPFFQSVLYELINTRLTEGRRTVISSNLDRNELRKRYTPQVVSRLEGEYQFLPFFGQDIRQLKKRG
jgi:DNA replication protein DnaC